MRYRKLLASVLLTSAICLISLFMLVGTAHSFAWSGVYSPKICVDGTCKSPNGEVECIFTFDSAEVVGYCYNYVNSQNVTDCAADLDADAVGWHAVNLTVVAAGAGGTKEQKEAIIHGCLDLSIFEEPCLSGGPDPETCVPNPKYVRTCNNSSVNWAPLPNSFSVSSMSISYTCTSLKTGKVIEEGTQECTWDGTYDGCSPEKGALYECIDEVIGKRAACE